jgi:protein SCO1
MTSRASHILLVMTAFLGGLLLFLGVILYATGQLGPGGPGPSAIGGPFKLIDQDGKPITDADLKGKPHLVFFGYTHCPDVCPTTMFDISEVFRALGPDADRAAALFVTVDPERDTPALLAQYVPAFNPTFVGLRPADQAQLTKVTKDFRIYYAKVPGKTPDSYTMDHTAASYVLDTNGKLRLFARDGQGAAPWVHDIKLLLD